MGDSRQIRTEPRQTIAILFDSFGPYHLARLRAAQASLDVIGIEIGSRSVEYPWFDSLAAGGALVRLFPGRTSDAVAPADLRQAIFEALDQGDPATVAVPGWGTRAALYALEWCATRDRPAIMMCDSTAMDARRSRPIEAIKRGIVRRCGSGFASGQRSVAYLESLGLPRLRVTTGYDVVDNDFFARGAADARSDAGEIRTRLGLPEGYILSLGRLVPKKNLENLVRGYHAYVAAAGPAARPLVIAGDGPLAQPLQALVESLGLSARVTFAGHVGYEDLPIYYGLAACFVLASTVEQWGLVVNEAIASGLPVIVSERCGASADLVRPGENGEICAPDAASIAAALDRLLSDSDLSAFGRRSVEIAADWGLDAFVAGLARASDMARAQGAAPGKLAISIAQALLAARR